MDYLGITGLAWAEEQAAVLQETHLRLDCLESSSEVQPIRVLEELGGASRVGEQRPHWAVWPNPSICFSRLANQAAGVTFSSLVRAAWARHSGRNNSGGRRQDLQSRPPKSHPALADRLADQNAVFGWLRDPPRRVGVVQDRGYCSRSKPQSVSHGFQGYSNLLLTALVIFHVNFLPGSSVLRPALRNHCQNFDNCSRETNSRANFTVAKFREFNSRVLPL